jgi:hypothetical protein
MAWTAPRTWVTGETVTAALLNTHLKDNLLVTAPAVLTTPGDVLYASAANTPARLAAGTSAQFFRGGASLPAWTNTLEGPFVVNHTDRHVRMFDSDDSDDVNDYMSIEKGDAEFIVRHWDDSTSTLNTMLAVDRDDYILHSGQNAQSTGAVVIATDIGTSATALTTSGTNYLTATITTGGPAYVKGLYSVRITRDSAASVSTLDILPRDDGTNIDAANQSWADPMNAVSDGDLIPTAGDEFLYTGSFWVRHTATNTSTYQIFCLAGDNSRFSADGGSLYVESIQYPT